MKFTTKLKTANIYNPDAFLNQVNYNHTEPDEVDLDGGGVTIIWHVNVTQKESYLDIELDSVESIGLVMTNDETNEDFDLEFYRLEPNEPFSMVVEQGGRPLFTQSEWTIELNIEVKNNQLQIDDIDVDFETKTIELT